MSRLMRIFYILGAMLLVLVMMAISYQYRTAESYVHAESEKNAILAFKVVHLGFESAIDDQSHVLSSAKDFIESYKTMDYEDLLSYLKSEMSMNPLFSTLYYVTVDNEMVNASGFIPPATLDLRQRPWYKMAEEAGELIITEPFINASEDDYIVTLAIPVFQSGELAGVVAGDIPVERLQNLISNKIDMENDATVLVSKEGTPIYISDDLEDVGGAVSEFKALYNGLDPEDQTLNYGTYEADFQGESGYFHYHFLGNSEWVIYTFSPKTAFLTNYSQLKWVTYIKGGLVLVLFIVLFILQKRMIADPLVELEKKVEAIDVERHPEYQIDLNDERVLAPLVSKINGVLMKIYDMMRIIQKDGERLRNLNETLESTVLELSSAENQVTEQKVYFEALFRYSDEAIAMVDSEHRILEINRSFERLFGYRLDEVKGINLDEIISNVSVAEEANQLTGMLMSGRPVRTEGIRYGKGNRRLELGIRGVPMLFEGVLVGGYAIYTDISERKSKERYLEYVSTHDDLTDLYNRHYFHVQMELLDKEAFLPLGVVIMDVNGLKLINDAMGTASGDSLLRKVAHLLRDNVRPDDVLARIGGDEFGIIMPNTDLKTVEEVAESLRKLLKDIQIGEVSTSVSLGWWDRPDMNTSMSEVLKKAEDYMNKHKLSEGPSVRGKAIYAMIKTLHEKNKREEQHSIRVSNLSERLGTALNLGSRELQELKTMGLLHDIGKIAIREEILNKNGRLSEAEYEEIKKHPEIGYRILSSVNEMSEMADFVFAHHEKYDGSGYPRGLKGEEIPYLARVICVTDAFDAMTTDRSYRKAMTHEEAFTELTRFSGSQFDPKIVEIFINMMKKSV